MRNLSTVQYRRIWILNRSTMENGKILHRRTGDQPKRKWNLTDSLIQVFGYFLKASGLYEYGRKNARNIAIKEIDLLFNHLPDRFNGYRILHLTDLHLDSLKGIEDVLYQKIKSISYDTCFLTGDYRAKTSGGFQNIIEPFNKVLSAIKAPDGIFATLGNHDTYLMIEYLEAKGVRVLGNEKTYIERGGQKLDLTGVDDTYYYYTTQADRIIKQSSSHFKILLAHTPDLYDLAAKNQFSLYLCGHTHGGQICLPGGLPVITHVNCPRRYASGQWNYKGLRGYTSLGCGVVGIPVRFNNQSEITVITLRKTPVKV
jgi:uncharacterized protein